MNSRAARKAAAKEHNERLDLIKALKDLRAKIFEKHRVSVAVYDNSNEGMRADIERLTEILESDTPPPRPVARSRRDFARIQLAAIAAMAGINGPKRY